MIRLLVITAFVFCVFSVGLLGVKTKVHNMEARLAALQTTIKDDQKAIRVLKAEWSHLNDPARIKRLADTYLKLSPVSAEQIAPLSALPYSATETMPSRAADQPAPAPRKPRFFDQSEVASRHDIDSLGLEGGE